MNHQKAKKNFSHRLREQRRSPYRSLRRARSEENLSDQNVEIYLRTAMLTAREKIVE